MSVPFTVVGAAAIELCDRTARACAYPADATWKAFASGGGSWPSATCPCTVRKLRAVQLSGGRDMGNFDGSALAEAEPAADANSTASALRLADLRAIRNISP